LFDAIPVMADARAHAICQEMIDLDLERLLTKV
jgi:hypothetical protein